MNTWKVIFATLVIFATGVVVGGLVVNKAVVANPAASKPSGPLGNNPGQFRLQALQRRMDRELALRPDQDDQIHKIIAASQDQIGNLWKPVAQAVSKETQDTCDQIRAVLTPDQQAKFDAFSKTHPPDFGERGERGERHRPPGFPGGPSNRFPTNSFFRGHRRRDRKDRFFYRRKQRERRREFAHGQEEEAEIGLD